MNEDLTLRVLLLSPLDMDHDFPILCEKSTVDAYSHTGSVSIEMVSLYAHDRRTFDQCILTRLFELTQIRLPGTVNHHFRLYVTSCEENVNVVLPPGFRGAIYVNKAGCLFPKVQMSTGLRKGIDDGAVHMNPPCVDEDEDEVHITAAKSVQLRMVEDNVCREEKDRPLWIVESAGRIARVSRAFLFKDKTS